MSSSSPSTATARSRGLKLIAVVGLTLALSACDYVASFSKPKQTPEEAKAEGIALGAGCRQAGQSLEDCYQRNPDSLKAGIFAGWKDMHEYMAAKNIQTVTPPPPVAADKPDAEADAAKDAPKDDRAARRERRERERAEKDKDAAKSKDSDSDSKSSRKNRDDGSSKK
ncbi:hypothetical protein hmeg3_06800 [Herbaspirillum sp. meg3]|jgi:type IV secretory pathway VirB10-like protein|uniref:hypothetical protein n=1 Tax=Herbaspirillum sp. meg3 TaxID=2025949 RepID=UPI000B9828ED|nr:hypothetical protein [Herbaspirillum sp. meg3]ASU38034.1 hypothetical protein hmeg3_06800 [Herbaspirillum sp. meg3]